MLSAAQPPDRPTVVLVVGAAGAPQYGRQFAEWATRWEQAAEKAHARLLRLGGDDSTDTTDRQRLEAVLAAEPEHSPAPLWLVLLGHGTFDGQAAKFNLRGPDVSAAELAEWLQRFQRPVAVINCSASSGPFINALSGPDRVVITATKSGYEQNFARFGDYFSAAIADETADLDKDGQTSLLEAFLVASRRTAEFYQQQARLATETALIDDNGDGLGTPGQWFRGIRAVRQAKNAASVDGTRAHQWHLLRTPTEQHMSRSVRARRDALEQAIAALRQSKTSMGEETYYAKLEPLLLDLARLYAELEELEHSGRPAPPPAEPLDRAR